MAKNSGILAGSPSHIEILRKKEADPRRYRSRCNYYDKGTKYCTTASSHYYPSFCGNVAHCVAYNTSLLDKNLV